MSETERFIGMSLPQLVAKMKEESAPDLPDSRDLLRRLMDQTTRLCSEAWPEDRRSKQLSKSYIAQLAEEVGELAKASRRFWGRSLRPEESERGNKEPIIDEIGDALFVVLRLCWFYEVDPTQAIQRALDKFERRLKKIRKPEVAS